MRCTNKNFFRKNRAKAKRRILRVTLVFFVVITLGVTGYALQSKKADKGIETTQTELYKHSTYEAKLFAEDICVVNQNVACDSFNTDARFYGSLLFDEESGNVIYAEKVNNKLYPASTTKILTTYVALKYGELDSVLTVGPNAVAVPSDSSKANLQLGDRLTLRDALYALMLPSGNDCAVAIAEHISGSVEEFAVLMNREANLLGATRTHFINPHGYQDVAHYTTAYDLYLMFHEAIKNPVFLDVISSKQWTAEVIQKDGTTRTMTWKQSNQYVNGSMATPEGVQVIGGKTGTTSEAGACLVLYSTTEEGIPYVSIIMGAYSRPNLYNNMTLLLQAIPD